ncbi:DNA primase [Alcanivorax balearicus MACL04]|nr:hypothetical protein [Alloalcanivorax balearicus]MCU5781139.1 DNA primase [Alloalcanivorax balearicus MACL04]
MALEQGESLSRLLREALKPTMDDDTARRYWDDALHRLHTLALEQTLKTEEARPNPDLARLSELHRALARARAGHQAEP